MIVAVDASGGEYAPHEIVKGAIQAAREYEVEIALVGRKEILYVLAGRYLTKLGIKIIDASQIIDYHESPVEAIRHKQESSIVVGTNLVREGKADAFVSAGNTGAVLFSALMYLGKMEGIERPGVGALLSLNETTPVVLIDAGANADCRPNHLVQFAQLGSMYIKAIFGIESPTVGLLNNGEEEKKGNRLAQETHQLLKVTESLNFIGNVEGQDIIGGKANVVVTDGFTGNIVLKTLEGMSAGWLASLGQAGTVFSKAYSMPSRVIKRNVGLESLEKRLDFSEVGGSCLLGVNGTIIISHGRSRAKAIKNAIGLAKRTAERSVGQKIIIEESETNG